MAITLNEMSGLARAMVDADLAVEEAEAALSAAKEHARVLREETVPTSMQELGLTELVLETGEKLTIKQDVYASIPAANKTDAFDWLQNNGFGGMIKLGVTVDYPKEKQEDALAMYDELLAKGLNVGLKQDVNAQTLKAFLREQIASGNAGLPLDLFGARPVWTAKLTQAKKK